MNDGEVVYLVDDDLYVRDDLSAFLRVAGLQVIGFSSALDYLQHARTDSAACLVLDLQLPGINGLELQSRLVVELSPPIIFISGRGDIPSTVKAMKGGALEFLAKPINPEVLLPAIASAFVTDRANRERHIELARLKDRFALLSPREREVLPLVVGGLLNKQSAATLGITEVTLQIHRSHIMKKMAAHSLAELVRMAGKLGIPVPPLELGSRYPKEGDFQ